MKKYMVIYEWAGNNHSAYVPDLPGYITTGSTLEETEQMIREAIELYVEPLVEDGTAIPEPTTSVGRMAVAA